jgi:hypothetical protein
MRRELQQRTAEPPHSREAVENGERQGYESWRKMEQKGRHWTAVATVSRREQRVVIAGLLQVEEWKVMVGDALAEWHHRLPLLGRVAGGWAQNRDLGLPKAGTSWRGIDPSAEPQHPTTSSTSPNLVQAQKRKGAEASLAKPIALQSLQQVTQQQQMQLVR